MDSYVPEHYVPPPFNIPRSAPDTNRPGLETAHVMLYVHCTVKLKGRARWFFVTFRGVDYIDLDCHRSASQAKKSQIIHEEAGTAINSIYRQAILNVFSVLTRAVMGVH